MLARHVSLSAKIVTFGILATVWSFPVQGQFGGGFGFGPIGVVGGVSVDSNGMVRDLSAQDHSQLLQQLRASVLTPQGKLAQPAPLRMISLSKLQAAISQAISDRRPLSEEMLYLAGLQRIEYLFAYPETGDIVLAGPAEPWVVRDDASVVGKISGRPVLRLEDLLVALRTSELTQHEVISVSIDPTPEGELRLQQLLKRIGSGNGFNPEHAEPAMKEAFGEQVVTLTVVPKNSRMAQVLVAADYEMKRIAMHLEPSPVKSLPSYMEMIRDTGAPKGVQPRWWMACDYDSLLHSEDRLAWKITGAGVKTLTEDQRVSSDGARVGNGKSNKQAQRWADLFTAKFDELSSANSSFGDLRNMMDLNLVAAVIRAHDLSELAGCDLALLLGADSSQLPTPSWNVPQSLQPQCSFVRGRSGWSVSASGGVEINPWKIVAQTSKVDSSVASVRQGAQKNGDHWWWE